VSRPPYQITLTNLLLSVLCLALALGLTRLYPENELGLVTVGLKNLPVEMALSYLITVCLFGAGGALQNSFQRSLIWGLAVGFTATGGLFLCRYLRLSWMAAHL
jgi:hypothetical protein